VPAWCDAAEIRVNGKKVAAEPVLGFATVDRVWRSGDRVEMELPAKVRLEAIDKQHPDVAAVVRGPLVLMAVTEKQPKVTQEQALASKRVSKMEWTVETESGPMRRYSTYLRLG